MHFERVQPACAQALRALFERNAIPSVTDLFDPFALTAAKADEIAQHRGEDLYYLAIADHRPVGMSMLRGFDEGYAVPSFGIFVDHEAQRGGVGRRLTEWTLERARARGCDAVRLSVYASNAVAIGLYESLGFVERERGEVVRAGRPDERIVMSLDLRA